MSPVTAVHSIMGVIFAEELAKELGVSVHEAQKMMDENSAADSQRNMGNRMQVTRSDADALSMVMGSSIQHAPTAPEVSDADMALAWKLQEQAYLDTVRTDEAQLQVDAALSQQLSEPEFQCPACLDTFKVSDMFTVDCPMAHRLCFEDIRRHVEGRLQRREVAACPLCTDPIYEFSEAEVRTSRPPFPQTRGVLP